VKAAYLCRKEELVGILEERMKIMKYEMNRGRGGNRIWPFPVSLEPCFIPFHHNQPSRVTETPVEVQLPQRELPMPLSALKHIGVRLSAGDKYSAGLSEQFLLALSPRRSISFEVIGTGGRVMLQIHTAEADRENGFRQISSHYPGAQVSDEGDFLGRENNARLHARSYRLRESHLFRIRIQHEAEAYAPLLAVLSGLNTGQKGLLQVLFQPVRNPWRENIMKVACDPWDPGKSSFADLPGLPKKAQDKIERPLFSIAVRLAASTSGILDKLEGAFLSQFESGENGFTPVTPPCPEDAIIGRYTRTDGMLLNVQELASLVHLPDPGKLADGCLELSTTTAMAPRPTDEYMVFLGTNCHQDKETQVGISQTQLAKHVAILGSTGSGKTTLLSQFLGALRRDCGLILIDLKGSGAEAFVGLIPEERINDTIYLDFGDPEYPPSLNLLWASNDKEREELPAHLLDVFKRLFRENWGQQMERILRQCLRTVASTPDQKTLKDLRRLLLDESYRREIVAQIEDPDLLRFWKNDFPKFPKIATFPILNRLSPLLDVPRIRNIVCQPESIDFQRLMNEGKILICNLAKGGVGDSEAILIGSYILARLQIAVMGRVRIPSSELKPFMIIVDEFHNLGGYGSDRYSIESLFAEARQFGVSFVTATQSLSKLRNEIAKELLVNARTLICLNSSFDEAKIVEPELGKFCAADITNLKVGQAIARMERSTEAFNFTFPRMRTPANTLRERIRRSSRESYCRSRTEVEKMLKEEIDLTSTEPAEELKTEEKQFLEFVVQNLDKPVTQVYKALGFGAWKGNRVRESLKERNFLKEIETRLGKRKTLAKFLIPTFEALQFLGLENNGGRGGAVHRHIQKLVKEQALAEGFAASREWKVEDGIVDVHLERNDEKIAVEISVVPNIEREIGNINKCLSQGYNKVYCIVLDGSALFKLEEKAIDIWADNERTKVVLLPLSSFSGFH